MIKDNDFSRVRLQDCCVIFSQTLVVGALYCSNVLQVQNSLLTLNQFVERAGGTLEEAAAALQSLEEVSEADMRATCLLHCSKYVRWHKRKRTLRWWLGVLLDVSSLGQLGHFMDCAAGEDSSAPAFHLEDLGTVAAVLRASDEGEQQLPFGQEVWAIGLMLCTRGFQNSQDECASRIVWGMVRLSILLTLGIVTISLVVYLVVKS
eukprot:TRINITY_DN1771_c0_g1_i1.p1 TRINITY_DN1771_c0_g1~~TRINITY_DN1771_c0_g1_i1.p1  ORF type:complete len:206 (-),score=34.79 TRINITY_DN1771_c0_g1_i1:6-623(-)